MELTVETMLILIVIYLRVSTEEQAKRGFSIPEQRDACWNKARELARELERTTGCKVEMQVEEVVDDFGGDIFERPQLEAIREFVRKKRPRFFVCLNPDRFSRDLEIQLKVTKEILVAGCGLEYVEYDFNPDPEGMLQYQVRGAVSEFEKKQILKRTSRGKTRKVKEGGRPNGACPYGYTHNKATDQLEIYDPEARWVRIMFQWAAFELVTPHTICKQLNDLGVPTKRGATGWRRAVVRRILRNTSYIGQMQCNRHDFRGLTSRRRLPREKREPLTAKHRLPEHWITVPVPAIIDQQTFERAQTNLAVTSTRGGRRDTGLLSMLLRCGVCGSGMAYVRKKTGRHQFRCHHKYAYLLDYRDPHCCSNPHHQAVPIEEGIWAKITDWLTIPDLLEEYLTDQGDNAAVQDQIRRLEAEHSELEQQLADQRAQQRVVIQKQARALLADEDADALLEEIRSHTDRITTALASLSNRIAVLSRSSVSVADTVAAFRSVASAIAAEAETVRKQLSEMPADERREVVLQLIKTVKVNADGTWRIVTS